MTQIFLFSIYALTTLAAFMLTVAEEFPLPTGLTVLLAPVAFVLNERRRTLRFDVRRSNILGLVGVGLALFELFVIAAFQESGTETERRVLAGAHLLTYMTWVSLFQAKEPRHYWILAALGLMQVAVGSILSNSPFFGLLFFIYVFLGLWTLSVFSLFQAEYSLMRANRDAVSLAAPHEHPLGTSLLSQLVHREPDNYRNAIQLDPNDRWINSRFIAGVLGTSIVAICVGLMFFVLVPRMWVSQRPLIVEPDDIPVQMVVGQSHEVQLGQIGQILESNAKAFEVRFFNARSNEELDVAKTAIEAGYETPMFRGSVMGTYDGGRWQVLPESRQWRPLLTTTERSGVIRQQFVVSDSGATTLFGMHPITAADKTGDGDDVGIDLVTSILQRSGNRSRGQLTYSLYSFRPTSQPKPRVLHLDNRDAFDLRMSLMEQFRKLPPTLRRLTELAKEIRSNVPPDDEQAFANAVQNYLSDSSRFEYSLKAEITDPDIDPVEDFLFNRRSGHCEYFASAMALLLRSQGIPTRLVSGYKGGDKHPYSGAFVVEQRHAHAWVEALVRDRWYTFDPTPAGREEVVRQIGYQRSLFSEMRETLAGLWTKNVVQMSLEQQLSQLYEPATNAAARKMPRLRPLFELLKAFASDPLRFFSPTIWFVTVFVLGSVYGVLNNWRRALPQSFSFRGWLQAVFATWRDRAVERVSGRRVDFYERFVKILHRQGFTRSRSQTPLEFVAAIEPQLETRLSDPELRRFPSEVTSRFYAVRFGDHSLSAADAAWIQTQLTNLELALKTRPTSHP